MPAVTKGTFSFNLGIFSVQSEISDEDRQCAWELYTEMVTRRAITGKIDDETCEDFSGELFNESLSSTYSFFQEARQIMKKFPVGKIRALNQQHLGSIIHEILNKLIRPFLEKWQSDYYVWWESNKDRGINRFELQDEYPRKDELLNDWKELRTVMRDIQKKMCNVYKLEEV